MIEILTKCASSEISTPAVAAKAGTRFTETRSNNVHLVAPRPYINLTPKKAASLLATTRNYTQKLQHHFSSITVTDKLS